MLVALAANSVLWLSALAAGVVVFTPRFGLVRHPHGSLLACIVAAEVALAIIAIQVVVPLTRLSPFAWDRVTTDYFLAMAHRVNGAPYPFFWAPPWVYWMGGLTLLLPISGALAMMAAYPARRVARRLSIVSMSIGSTVLVLYVSAAVHAAFETRLGVGL